MSATTAPATLIAQKDSGRYGRAAVRWHGRFALETTGLELADSQLALAALASLPSDVGVLARCSAGSVDA